MVDLKLLPGVYKSNASQSSQSRRKLQASGLDLTSAAKVWFTMSPQISASELRITGTTTGVIFELDDEEEGFVFLPGAPPFVINGVNFTRATRSIEGTSSPAIRIKQGNRVVVSECSFSGYKGPAVLVEGGNVRIHSSLFISNSGTAAKISAGTVEVVSTTFARNGAPEAKGGAIQMTGGDVLIASSLFDSNIADSGGAIFASCFDYDCRLLIRNSTLTRNKAATGGALSVALYAVVYLRDKTSFAINEVTAGGAGGRTAYIDVRSKVAYVLPAPLGQWVTNFASCSAESTESELKRSNHMCVEDLYNNTLAAMLPGALDDDYPLACAPGICHHTIHAACSVSITSPAIDDDYALEYSRCLWKQLLWKQSDKPSMLWSLSRWVFLRVADKATTAMSHR